MISNGQYLHHGNITDGFWLAIMSCIPFNFMGIGETGCL